MINNYASFKVRLLATLIDGALSGLILVILLYFIADQATLPKMVSAAVFSLMILLNPLLLYLSIIFTHYLGGSPGKLLTGLRILSTDGKRLSFNRILFRQTIGYSFSWIFFGLGYLSVIKDVKKQAWHDKTVNSQVVAVQNLFIVGLMILFLLFFALISLFTKSAQAFYNSPALVEIQDYLKKAELEREAQKNGINNPAGALQTKPGFCVPNFTPNTKEEINLSFQCYNALNYNDCINYDIKNYEPDNTQNECRWKTRFN